MDANAVIAAALAGNLTNGTFKRWTAKRKAALVRSIFDGNVTAEQARERFEISPDELETWMRAYERAAMAGNAAANLHVKRMVENRARQSAIQSDQRSGARS